MIEYEQISPDVIKVTGVYEGDIRYMFVVKKQYAFSHKAR